MLRPMDDRNPAEELPIVYREVLDALARLEAGGDRAVAYELRQRAQRTYASRWDDGGRRVLQRILRDADARHAAGRQADAPRTLVTST